MTKKCPRRDSSREHAELGRIPFAELVSLPLEERGDVLHRYLGPELTEAVAAAKRRGIPAGAIKHAEISWAVGSGFRGAV